MAELFRLVHYSNLRRLYDHIMMTVGYLSSAYEFLPRYRPKKYPQIYIPRCIRRMFAGQMCVSLHWVPSDPVECGWEDQGLRALLAPTNLSFHSRLPYKHMPGGHNCTCLFIYVYYITVMAMSYNWLFRWEYMIDYTFYK